MDARLGLDQRDIRNMGVVVGVMALVMLVLLDGPLLPRLVAAIVFGVVSATAFLLVTILINTVTSD